VATRRLSSVPRRSSMVGAILLACGVFALVRTGGMTGDGNSDLHWRWTKTPEQRLLAQAGDEPAARPSTPAVVAAATPEQPLPAPAQPEPLASTSAPTSAKTPEKPPVPSAAETRAHWAGFPRTHRRRRHSRRGDRDRLVEVAAGLAVAPPRRTRLVVLRGPRQPPLHPGAARRGRGRLLLQPDHRRAGVETQERDPVLGVEWRRWSA